MGVNRQMVVVSDQANGDTNRMVLKALGPLLRNRPEGLLYQASSCSPVDVLPCEEVNNVSSWCFLIIEINIF